MGNIKKILFSPEFSRNFITGPKLSPYEFSKLRPKVWPFRVGFISKICFHNNHGNTSSGTN